MSSTLVKLDDIKSGQLFRITQPYDQTYGLRYGKDIAKVGELAFCLGTPKGPLAVIREGKAHFVYTSNKWVPDPKNIYYGGKQEPHMVELIEDPAQVDSMMKIMRDSVVGPVLTNIIGRGRDTGLYVGSDPEMFVVDKAGIVIPAFTFLPDKKNAPSDSFDSVTKQPYYDGFQAEFNILAQQCHVSAVANLATGLRALIQKAKTFNPDAKLSHKSVLEVPEAMMQSVSDQHAALGCSPSQNVYPNTDPLYVDDPRALPLRFAGFHIHYGHEYYTSVVDKNQRRFRVEMAVRSIDRIAGPIITSMLQGIEDPRRRHFYGRAGEYRMPPHGFEYRVHSSTALCHPLIAYLTLDFSRYALMFAYKNRMDWWETPGGDAQVQHILNNYDIAEAQAVLKKNEAVLDAIIDSLYGCGPTHNEARFKGLKNIIFNGAKNYLPCEDVTSNWSNGYSYVSGSSLVTAAAR